MAKGLALGTASHAIGTAKAMEMGEVEGAMSSLAIAVACLRPRLSHASLTETAADTREPRGRPWRESAVEIMPVMFIPAAAGLLDSWPSLKPMCIPIILITLLTTVIVMAVTGLITQLLLRR